MEFRCRLASPSGQIIEGVYSADNEARLRHELEEKGLYVLSLQAKGAVAGIAFQLPQQRRIPSREFLVFNQELATLLKAGMPLVQSLDLLKRRVEAPVFRAAIEDVHEKVKSGTALSDAFASHGDLFPSVYTASLFAGERSGSLDTVLRRYVDYARVVATVKRKTLSALVYPAILVMLALAVVTLIIVKVVPEFSEFYKSYGATLPLATRIIVKVSDVVRGQIVFILIAVVAAIAAAVLWLRQPANKKRLHHLVLRLPVIGPITAKFATAQMARTLATLLGGGLPLVNALDIASKSIGNKFMASELDVVNVRVREGESFSAALAARGVFPDVAVKMTEVGESTGALQEMLNTVADFFDEEIGTNMERFVTLVEPLLLVVMGIVIAGLVLALYMPLFQLSSVLSQ